MDALKARIRHVPDFPKPGILFYDITTLLQDPAGFRAAIDALAAPFADRGIELVVAVESRGFIFGAAVADRLGTGFVPGAQAGQAAVRRPMRVTYRPGIRQRQPRDARGRRHGRASGCSIVDDLLATGGTAKATAGPRRGTGRHGARPGVPRRADVPQRAREAPGRTAVHGPVLRCLTRPAAAVAALVSWSGPEGPLPCRAPVAQ